MTPDNTTDHMVRPVLPSDWPRIREICCLTGLDGNPIEENRWPFFSDLWIGPYEWFYPHYCFVLVHQLVHPLVHQGDPVPRDSTNRVVGYITATPNTEKLNRLKRFIFNPFLVLKIIFLQKKHPDMKKFLDRWKKGHHLPEDHFSAIQKIESDYPAHLHINILKEHRGLDLGALLIGKLFTKLKEEKSKGLHLFCADGPLDFYFKHGLKKIASVTLDNGATVNLLGIRFGI